MKFTEWEPVYSAILRDFGYSRTLDEQARDRLAELAIPYQLEAFDEDTTVGIAGGAGSLEDELSVLRDVDAVIGVSRATALLREAGVPIAMMMTDLDKVPETARELTHEGTLVVVHAHGDNIQEIQTWVPRFDTNHVLATTQAAPRRHVQNFGGFTDGDRAAFLVDALRADSLVFAGWDFDDQTVPSVKRKKLAWAERLLRWLEIRRGERFNVLDGRRDAIDMTAIPLDQS